ncbi:Outer membrane lipoprotein-sorting protein [Natronorubrum sediminis]|uniref:Outer membrane lipoprotein-sorting protein n=1 Tax=Natronorubrum sediminis TaxID=640943 RepID=A0A1H6FL55_9EURY|nr:outer membrane lipoprotein carrier protein LolA [Natronorubrum sediminis]SEH11586.1 Outer membrane lipoprotein-sorting protein [Natronorubrum sediminis]
MASRRVAAAVCVLTLILTLSGCVALESISSQESEDPAPEDVFEGAFVHSDDLEDVEGIVTTTVTDGNETIEEREDRAERPYVEQRSETLESTDDDREGEVYVSNESMSWWYDSDAQAATYFESDEPFDTDEVRADRAEMADEQRDLYDLEYQGTETIADREAHVLDVEAKDEAVEAGLSILVGDTEYVYALETVDPDDELDVVEQTIWIDTEYAFPLKEHLVVDDPDGDRHELTERYETVSFNQDLGDETFDFEPPANTTVTAS